MLWVLKLVENDLAFVVCGNINDLFKTMCPGEISKDFACGLTKATCLILLLYRTKKKNYWILGSAVPGMLFNMTKQTLRK